MLAAARLCVLIEGTVKNQDWQSNQRKLILKSLVGPNHRRHSLCGLSFIGNQWIVVHCLDGLGVARKSFVGEVKHTCMWSNVTQPFENCEREIGRRQLMSETLADQPRQRSRVVHGV